MTGQCLTTASPLTHGATTSISLQLPVGLLQPTTNGGAMFFDSDKPYGTELDNLIADLQWGKRFAGYLTVIAAACAVLLVFA